MSSSTKVDVNYLSCSNGIWGYNEGGPNPTPAPAPVDGAVLSPENADQYASILKLCDNSVVHLSNIEVVQGQECSVDINNHATVNLQGEFGVATVRVGNQIFSVKGASYAAIAGTLKGAGNRMDADVLVDNWSDQAYGGSTVDLTNAVHQAGRKIKVVKRLFASTVKGDVETLWLQSIGMTAYWWLKWIVRKILGIKVGQKGPSWL